MEAKSQRKQAQLRSRINEGMQSAQWMRKQVRWLSPRFTCVLVGFCILVLLLTLLASLRQHGSVEVITAKYEFERGEKSIAAVVKHIDEGLLSVSPFYRLPDPEKDLKAFLALNPAIDRLVLLNQSEVLIDTALLTQDSLTAPSDFVPKVPLSLLASYDGMSSEQLYVVEAEATQAAYSGVNKRYIYAVKRINSLTEPVGQFVIAELSRAYFNRQLNDINVNKSTGVALLTGAKELISFVGYFDPLRLKHLSFESSDNGSPSSGNTYDVDNNLMLATSKIPHSNLYLSAHIDHQNFFWSWLQAHFLVVIASLFLSALLTVFALLYVRHDKQRAPLLEELRIAAVAFNVQNGMVVTDHRGKILRVNQAFEQLLGFDAQEVEGRSCHVLQSVDSINVFRRIASSLRTSDHWEGEVVGRKKDGQTFPLWLSTKAVRDDSRAVTHFVAVLSDMSERKAAEEEITRLAFYDPLTSLPNRRLFNERLPHVMKTSHRTGQFGALMVIDLDHFKTINDTRGHDVGDALLVEIAQRLQSILRDSDTVARIGGDEFVVLLENLGRVRNTAEADVQVVATKILDALSVPIDAKGQRFNISTSGGTVLFKGVLRSHDEIFKYADIALYEAKGLGRNRFELFNEAMLVDLSEAVEMAEALEKAIKEDKLSLFLQPQFDKSRRMVAAEALVRWLQEDGSQIEPKVMIPIAEKNDLILLLGDWVLNRVCQMVNRLVVAGVEPSFQLSVNISTKQFIQQDFAQQLKLTLRRNNTDPKYIKLELTENLMLSNIEVATSRMRELKELGISLDVDDFGTGFSSLTYLQSLPIDSLKIDGSFLANVGSNSESSALIHSTIMMAQALQLKVVAEGVENSEQLKFLESHDCDLFQGYLLCMPIPSEDFESRMLKQIKSDQCV